MSITSIELRTRILPEYKITLKLPTIHRRDQF